MNLQEIRKSRGLSQSELSRKSGVNVRMIQHYEQGVKNINKAQGYILYSLAQALKCSIEDLLELREAIVIPDMEEEEAEYINNKILERMKEYRDEKEQLRNG